MKGTESVLLRPSKWRGFLVYWLPALATVALISVASSFSSATLDEFTGAVGGTTPNQVLFHVGQFAIFSLLVFRLTHFHLKWPFHYLALVVLLVSAGYGALDELHQSFVPGRDPSIYDVGSDVLGAMLGIVLSGGLLVVRRRRSKAPSGPEH